MDQTKVLLSAFVASHASTSGTLFSITEASLFFRTAGNGSFLLTVFVVLLLIGKHFVSSLLSQVMKGLKI